MFNLLFEDHVLGQNHVTEVTWCRQSILHISHITPTIPIFTHNETGHRAPEQRTPKTQSHRLLSAAIPVPNELYINLHIQEKIISNLPPGPHTLKRQWFPCRDTQRLIHIDGVVQDRCNCIANALKILQSCTYLSIYTLIYTYIYIN